MNLILKWLHRNELLVHMVVLLLVFYGIPVVYLSFTNSTLIAPVINSAISGFTLITLFLISYKVAVSVTDLVKIAVEKAAIEQIRDSAALITKIEKDAIVDYTSPNMLVVTSHKSEKMAAEVDQPVPVEKKTKRAHRSKSVKKVG